ncbi:Tpr-related protein family member, putative [Theileria annulata]|uniref:Tpr-related protein family member, putative n=1 Tax=Theileria annulata TaxID=5874 RepID=Q4UHK1_THEAN|nr:Tpr-related protein family member, putative [Theileria annulata]CAI73438.1 Tpr-related protein family member, putative [Theileria annulata]|eukprot:XP_954115.1 Tpr-related protein family member, putative [Theileria annulata]
MSAAEAKKNGCTEAKKIAAYLLVGFSLLLTLRVGMNGAPFCMKRFKIPEHLFSLYVSRVHNAIELGGFLGQFVSTVYTIKYGQNADGPGKEQISIAINWLFFLINVVLFFVFVTGGEEGHLTDFYWALAFSAFVYGMNLTFILKLAGDCIVYYLATLHVSGIFVSVYHFLFLRLFGNRRKFNTDYLIITWQLILSIIITAVTAGVWTAVYAGNGSQTEQTSSSNGECSKNDSSNGNDVEHVVSPMIMCVFAQGIVYVFYPAIAPGLIVDFRHVNKIDQALLIIAPMPAITFAVIDAFKLESYSPKCKWSKKLWWHGTLIFIPIMITCGYLFIKALHYPHSGPALAIINKPRMAGFLTILFYLSHMILLAVGFPGVEKNSGGYKDYLTVVNGFMATTSMIIFVFLAEGYINEFKKHDMSNWPTEGLSAKRAFGFWFDKAIQNGWKNFKLIFTRDLRRDLMTALDVNYKR